MNLSARAIYLYFASVVVLFFIGTGVYYLLGSTAPSTPETYLQVVDKSSTSTGGEEDEIFDTVPPPPTQAVSAATAQPQVSAAPSTPNPLLAADEGNLSEIQSVIDESQTLESNATEPAAIQCFDTCEYNYECPGTLTCLPADGVKRCVNPLCPSSSTCSCGAALDGKDEPSNLLALAERSPGLGGGIDTPVAVPPKPATTTTYAPALPKAGSSEVTFLVLVFAAISTSLGLIWLQARR